MTGYYTHYKKNNVTRYNRGYVTVKRKGAYRLKMKIYVISKVTVSNDYVSC